MGTEQNIMSTLYRKNCSKSGKKISNKGSFSFKAVVKSRRLATSSRVAGLALATLLVSGGANADIRFENKSDNNADRGERFSLDVRNEPIADVMDALSERYEFSVDGYPEHWSDKPMSFSATGDLERVLRSLLKDTSHVFEYHTDLKTRETRITRLNLLNDGVEGFVASKPAGGADSPVSNASSNKRRPGRLADRADPDRLGNELANGGRDSLDNPINSPINTTPRAPAQVSGLSRSLEQRARLSSGTPGASSSSQSSNSATPSVEPGVPNADMQALTRKALQDVQGLAEALKKAESGR